MLKMKIAECVVILLLLLSSAGASSASCSCDSGINFEEKVPGLTQLNKIEQTACGIQNVASDYSKVVEPTLAPIHLEDLPGYTRSVYERDYALITPESQVYSPISGWSNSLCAFLITPAIGSHFSMYFAKMTGNSSAAQPSTKGVERFIFVIDGHIELVYEEQRHVIQSDGFAYLPPDTTYEIRSKEPSVLLVYERRYTNEGIVKPELVLGMTHQQPLLEAPGEVFALRKLLPTTSAYDFNVHVMDFQPGEYLNVKEVHYNQHGLLLLEGRGIYRLGKDWYPVQAGDVIWMAPYVPQWYAALGRTRSRYILYKDVNRDPLLHPH
ncbi:hypothetical protein R1sor_012507 [Riccia sorocarpa]|uniref:Cupin type-2 domain-containing protein n=1 Tax=Riccia sorocarpa TaxID=122646 RepID=A0ABD3I558_9MARC